MKKLYEHALEDFGLAEVPGSGTNARITKAISEAAEWLEKDDSVTAWCGCIMGLWFKEIGLAGLRPKAWYRAANWATVGKEVKLSEARVGDVVVMGRKGGKHVTLFSKLKGEMVYCLGGNQNNQVNVSAYNKDLIETIRRIEA